MGVYTGLSTLAFERMSRFRIKWFYLLCLSALLSGCKAWLLKVTESPDDQLIKAVIIQLGDMNDLFPDPESPESGLSQVATVIKQQKLYNDRVLVVATGDIMGTSMISSLPDESATIAGKHIIEGLNALGVDMVLAGQPASNVSATQYQQRIHQSNFRWLATNTRYRRSGDSLTRFTPSADLKSQVNGEWIWDISDEDGTKARIGFVGAVTPRTAPADFYFPDWQNAVRNSLEKIRDSSQLLIALSGLRMREEEHLASRFPEIQLILSGRSAEAKETKSGTTKITKAGSNAASVWVHKIIIDTRTKTTEIKSEVVSISNRSQGDGTLRDIQLKWAGLLNKHLQFQGIEPAQVVTTLNDPWNLQWPDVSTQSTNFTYTLGRAFKTACPKCEAAVFPAGMIYETPIKGKVVKGFDIARILPTGGALLEVHMQGSLIKDILEAGITSRGRSGFIHYEGIRRDSLSGAWFINAEAVRPQYAYKIAIPEALFASGGLPFLWSKQRGIERIVRPDPADKTNPMRDVRAALIHYLRQAR